MKTKLRVAGIGGIFFKAKSPAKLGAWYQKHLGLPLEGWGGCAFPWRDAKNPKKTGMTVWSPSGAVVATFNGEVDGGNIQSTRIKH